LNIEDPVSCVKFIQLIAGKWYDKVKSHNQMGDMYKTNEEYERLLQKSELKIRDFIRVGKIKINYVNCYLLEWAYLQN